MLLSIITPYYDTLEYTKNLSKILIPQLNNEVEWIIIDDGCHEKELDKINANVIHTPNNSGNASIPRNIGIEKSIGKYIAFIDSDDTVSDNYIELILDKIKASDFDYCYIGWETDSYKYLIEEEPSKWNTCVWNCIYKRKIIGDIRFNPNSNMGEDKEFNQKVRKGKRDNILEILYHYNYGRPNSLTTLYSNGQIPWNKED